MTEALMDDFPPAPDRLVTLSNWRKAPFSAWGFRNVRRLIPTANIAASGEPRRSRPRWRRSDTSASTAMTAIRPP